ncbi:hypothetical protein AWB67_00923 [Caballeronia terrestris]|uniref:Uncharacterized protein n=1 Tax=Caballeronia terrestris TaxID=1226301 RepID=A0A158FWX0_9BURK|nr:hypothetical protein [Caballeronia terrestris]SAL24282.1 hypothetical protein AWB67_00923 [Caballeronia terrestris]
MFFCITGTLTASGLVGNSTQLTSPLLLPFGSIPLLVLIYFQLGVTKKTEANGEA